jgi:hypothetical protein
MNDYITRGPAGWVQTSIESTSDPRNGDTTTITGTAANQATAITQTLYYRNLGWSVSCKQLGQGDRWTVTATYNADLVTDSNQIRVPDVQWEVLPHAIEKNIFECTDRPFIQSLSTTTKALIEAACKVANKEGNPVLTTVQDVSQLPNATQLYNLKVMGVDSKQIFTTSVKRSITVSTRYNVGWMLTYNDMILSKAFLVNTYAMPFWVANLLPQGDIALQTDNNGIATFWGYLENRPSYQSVAGNRVTVSQEWVYNKWSAGPTGLYDVQY